MVVGVVVGVIWLCAGEGLVEKLTKRKNQVTDAFGWVDNGSKDRWICNRQRITAGKE